MFIDMLSQPEFDSYDISSLRGGKYISTHSNWPLLVLLKEASWTGRRSWAWLLKQITSEEEKFVLQALSFALLIQWCAFLP